VFCEDFVNVTMYLQYNNNIIKRERIKEECEEAESNAPNTKLANSPPCKTPGKEASQLCSPSTL
jgi:hypothetical protein